ncbi:hypothetical protein KOR42_08640 [Thalassoglobus neptunius]|uniref:Uncharacterized protein n=1 Tax=Thalassoglobus neptunius TaxID=1938619 RepID=A0A5C5X5H6_9PLAN|nr:hypothetical protein [Thalassoglobus neptunius]TWT57503.1 hypothetical protein KOR42_08640 [Thalassoglobus neptunius]
MIPVQPKNSGESTVDHNNRARTQTGLAADRTFHSAKQIMARRVVLTQLYLIAALLWLGSTGCQSRIDSIHEQFSGSADQKMSRIDQIVKSVATQGEPTTSYVTYREAKMLLELYSDSDDLNEADLAAMQEIIDAQSLSFPSTIEFRETDELPYGNAGCMFLFPGDDSVNDQKTWEFNTGETKLFPKLTMRDPEKLQTAYERFQDLEYVLIVTPEEIIAPEATGDDNYDLGAIVGVAYLFEVESGNLLGSFDFKAPGQNLITGMIWDFTLGDDEEANLELLTDRLHRDALRYAEAAAAELSDQVNSYFEIRQQLYLSDDVVDTRVHEASE